MVILAWLAFWHDDQQPWIYFSYHIFLDLLIKIEPLGRIAYPPDNCSYRLSYITAPYYTPVENNNK
jgi:hypothetical protein